MEAQETKNEFRIPVENMEKLQEKMEKLSKKANKLGIKAPVLTVLREEVEEILFDGKPTGEFRAFNIVSVEGVEAKIAGWNLVAALDHSHEAGNLVRSFQEVPKQYFTAQGNCDHCGHNRKRHMTVIVEKDGVYKQVGRSCLKDFMGHGEPEAIVSYFEYIFEFCKSQEEYSGGFRRLFQVQDFLTVAACAIRQFGFVPSRTEDGYATVSRIWNHYAIDAVKLKNRLYPTQEDSAMADKAIEWAKTLVGSDNQYLHNLSLIANSLYLKNRESGFAASLVQAYRKEVEKIKAKEFTPRKSSEWVGQVGDKIQVNVEVLKVISFETQLGYSYCHRMKDEEGNVFTWFTGKRISDEGEKITLKGTVKSLDLYKEEKQTILTRCKVV